MPLSDMACIAHWIFRGFGCVRHCHHSTGFLREKKNNSLNHFQLIAIAISITMICSGDDDPYYSAGSAAALVRRQERDRAHFLRQKQQMEANRPYLDIYGLDDAYCYSGAAGRIGGRNNRQH
jgi:hypothetical protein